MNENVEEKQRKKSSPIHVKGGGIVNYGVEVAYSEVEYIGSENLSDLEDIDTSLEIGFLLLKHSIMGDVISLVVKSLKNPRSAVCKTAIMTSAYTFTPFNDHVVDLLDPLLVQLLLKSSQDKKFVCEAAERALEAMTTWVSPNVLLPKLQPYLKTEIHEFEPRHQCAFLRVFHNWVLRQLRHMELTD